MAESAFWAAWVPSQDSAGSRQPSQLPQGMESTSPKCDNSPLPRHPVLRPGIDGRSAPPSGGLVGLGAAEAIDDPALPGMAPADEGEQLAPRVVLECDLVADIGPVEACQE